jgi:hypothetical protein
MKEKCKTSSGYYLCVLIWAYCCSLYLLQTPTSAPKYKINFFSPPKSLIFWNIGSRPQVGLTLPRTRANGSFAAPFFFTITGAIPELLSLNKSHVINLFDILHDLIDDHNRIEIGRINLVVTTSI